MSVSLVEVIVEEGAKKEEENGCYDRSGSNWEV